MFDATGRGARRCATAVLVVLAAACARSSSHAGVTPDRQSGTQSASADVAKLAAAADAWFAPHVAERQFSGTVLIARGDRVLFEKGYGLANAELGVPNTAETVFRIASISKTFTAAAIVMLAERGALRYTDTLGKYLPEFPAGNRITIRQLLLHSSGVGNPDYERIIASRVSLTDLVGQIAAKPLLFPPGSTSQYSNGGYVLLAAVVERASGMSYADFLAKNIAGPLALGATMPDVQEAVISSRASGYVPGPPPAKLENVVWYDMSAMTGSGSLVSTARDLHRWARAVHRETLYRRTALPYPFGWGVRKYFNRDLIEQSGSLDGFTSYVGVYFADSTYVVCLTNVEAGLNNRCGQDLAAIAFGEPARALEPIVARATSTVAAADTGLYSAAGGGGFRLLLVGGHAHVRWETARTSHYAIPVGRDSLTVGADRSLIVLQRDASGRATAVTRGYDGSPPARYMRR